ncbi:endonuclease/exonuclease/phosphatase family metal-dependent hydrolase [Micromonospora pisi]|uniref:Endonuclease/exonuclease/phosphatase family metal-dependent hydrolase n=1 Tax=Micromonospora pisi TaxID=589240 RepID=A0A495JVU2_9ACTN|nr:endonuclease/exonuclease/phosphatase family protein [Micromonospora pisi]RKR93166.1 endonuclease/exonuclease/phosphatase family metal-dependent hydrolase [Micromonospora pisi]
MRLVTFNLLHGRSLHDGMVDQTRLTDTVTALDADILALQEVDRDQSRSGHLDLTAIAAQALDAPTHRFAAAVVGTPGEGFRPLNHEDDGHGEPLYGVGLVSRYPARAWRVTRLTPAPLRAPIYISGPGGGFTLLHDEPRVLLAAVLDTPHGPITAAATHLSFVPGWNLRQLRQVVRALRSLPAPRILLGDLNLPARLATLVSRWHTLGCQPTYPSAAPQVQLDHILADPRGSQRLPAVTAVTAPAATISDHRPLVVDLG